MERTLLLMRHSEAGFGITGSDIDRSLTHAGMADSRAAGTWLADEVGPVDLVLCSSSARTRQTWRGMTAGGASGTEVSELEEIYDGGADDLLDLVHGIPDSVRTALVLGHSPGIPTLAHRLAADGSGSDDTRRAFGHGFPTSTIVRLAVDRSWIDLDAGQADLVTVVTPRA
ncbi:histidine phosphatase family protein [Arsenicicoccus piscis]|uniref:SixA phosphatase family protein n=1 Tax=Arsenicicoccus piscis TaxID=673954 RepID=UPI001F4C68C6|nr:histidine phosphatase family protein [Arsenicicoccus piscis]MCH8626951.1 histidine phosphatase family protein [Arsenicicoccus piscis]